MYTAQCGTTGGRRVLTGLQAYHSQVGHIQPVSSGPPLVSNSMIVNKCEGGGGGGGGGIIQLTAQATCITSTTNASCANSNRRPGRPSRLCKRLHMQRSAEEEKSLSDYRFLLQTPHRHCAVTVCGNLIGNKSAICSTCVSV